MMDIEIKKISGSVKIEKQEKRELVLLTLTAQIESDNARVVAAGVDVDGLELLPSVRIGLNKGTIIKEFPPLKIFRQYPEDGEVTPKDYTLTVAIGTGQELHARKDLKMTF